MRQHVGVDEGRLITDDGVQLSYTVNGSGPPLVLCHGGPGMWDYLGPLAALLDDRATVVRYDQRGSGRSDCTGPYTIARFVADLDQLRAHLGFESWIVGGHSFGATLALHYAFEHPERTRAVVYVSGVGIGRAWNAAYHAEADRHRSPEQRARLVELSARATRDPVEEREFRTLSWLPDYVADAEQHAAALADAPFAINREARAINDETKTWREDDLAARSRQLTMPVLIVHGMLDPRPHWAIDSLAAALPNARVVKIAGAGHIPWLEQPAATAEAIRAFLRLE